MTRSDAGAAVCPFSGRSRPSTAAAAPPAAQATQATTTGGADAVRRGGPVIGRRTLLGGVAGLLVAARLAAVDGLGSLPAFAAGRRALKGTHGQSLRGMDIVARYGRDKEARFGLMFKKLPAFNPSDANLKALAKKMNDGKAPLADVKDSDVAFDTPLPAGYIYFGQFVDHDLTLDKTPLGQQKQDVSAMTNYDTPRFDLGSVYGGGPAANPELYDPARPGYLRTNVHDSLTDLPRDEVGAAFLGDPRNDENLIVAQLHTVFLRLHNKFRDQGSTFEQAQQQTRFHFQWLVVNDYLPRIVGQSVVDSILTRKANGAWALNTLFYKPKNTAKPYIPLEFSGAAYRFGHSQIRAEYEVQDGHTVPIFGQDGFEDLRGNRAIPHNLWIDWNYFFDIRGLDSPDDRNMARRIDTQISLPLSTLPPTVVAPTAGAILALAERNLLRGKRLGLPCGQDVAVAMGLTPLTDAQLGLTGNAWKGKVPLWFYVLKEAELAGGTRLGPVGGRIVAEVILSLVALDKTSYVKVQPSFSPGTGFTVGDLILLADAFDPRGRPGAGPVEPDPGPVQPDPGPVQPDPEPLEPVPVDPDEVILPEATDPLEGTV